ncbi:hypothetical protein F4820DRAFT_306697 [Hypoxylon rubiginosum]|uniref:Uncharacterized protein n=1 Tax=Hypoxylon rubiginosum TaxID=110542 RepID=A0ACB9Z210_9PEZI|nr:hypothetical protein F4820DRAFT_306697 [Hypoxylon rubiginosum]
MKNPLQLASPSEYANTGLVREFVRDDQSACSSADSHDPEVFDDDKLDYSGNGAGDGRSTPQTLISEGMPIPDGEGSMNEGKITKSSHVPDESLFRSMSRNGFLPGRAISHQRGTDMETKSNVIDLRKTDAQPRQHITDALYNFEKVEPSLKYTTSTPHSSLELGSVCSINVGFDEFVYRWKPGSMITFNVEPQSFPDTSYAAHATRSLEEAARKWNEGEVGVRFEKVADHEPAAFRLVYWKQNSQEPKTLAKAFLPIPSEVQRNQPQLFVYSIAFDKEKGNYNDLAKIFCHELGHVLGLRHEFAKEKESHMPCVQFGESNSSSVMNYFNHARKYRIQKSDYNDVRLFYAYKGTVYNGFRVIDVDPMYFTSPMQF